MSSKLNKLIILAIITLNILIAKEMKVYKSPSCGCCTSWVEAIKKKSNIKVQTIATNNLNFYKKKYKIEQKYEGCHTAIIDGYIIEGHVPMTAINKLLKEKPKNIHALSVPGMPVGSMGMEQGNMIQKYNVIAIRKDGSSFIYEKH